MRWYNRHLSETRPGEKAEARETEVAEVVRWEDKGMFIRLANRKMMINVSQVEHITMRENGNVVAVMHTGQVMILGTYTLQDAGIELTRIAEAIKAGQALYDMTPRERYDIQRR